MHELSWWWIVLELTVPPVAAGLVALPVWLKGEPIFGNLVGTAVIFGSAVGLILRERVELEASLSSAWTRDTPAGPIRVRLRAMRSTPSSRYSKSWSCSR